MNLADTPSEKRVLMLCYYYPPLRSSGTARSLEFSLGLPAYGWKPLVLSVAKSREPWANEGECVPEDVVIERSFEFPLASIVNLLHGVLSRLAGLFGIELKTNFIRENICIPDTHIAWTVVPPSCWRFSGIDCIYVSCSPFSAAVKASLLKALLKKPLVIDFRDPWTLNPHIRHSKFHSWVIDKLEKAVLQQADWLILNTKGAQRIYCEQYPMLREKCSVIPNGFDSLEVVEKPVKDPEAYTIMHVGTFYGSRNPTALLEALVELDDPSIEFVQIGASCPELERFQSKLRLRVSGMLPREAALKEMKRASLLYLKQGFEPGVTDYVAVAAKTYEYIATGLPILADCPPGDNVDVVRDYAYQSYIVLDGDKDKLAQAVSAARRSWSEYEPQVSAHFIEAFERASLTKKLAGVLKQVSARRVPTQ